MEKEGGDDRLLLFLPQAERHGGGRKTAVVEPFR
ncbi:hypothetical protein GA8_10270 [Geobacillus sp. A8]|nr:hypothetical protein GA8_10270 [Geobacillus sp. A8]